MKNLGGTRTNDGPNVGRKTVVHDRGFRGGRMWSFLGNVTAASPHRQRRSGSVTAGSPQRQRRLGSVRAAWAASTERIVGNDTIAPGEGHHRHGMEAASVKHGGGFGSFLQRK